MLFEHIGILDENFDYQPDKFVLTFGDRIVYIGDERPEGKSYEGNLGPIYNGEGKLLMPGFYNAHGHSPMSLVRGYGEGLELGRWLNERIFPFEAQLDGEAVYWGTLLSMAESLRFGIVSTTDMYMWVDYMVKAYMDSRTKANVCRSVTNFAHEDPEQLGFYKDMIDVIRMYDGFGEGRIKADASIHAEYSNDDATARLVAEAARKYDVNMHVHVAETLSETEGCKERHGGMTPVEYLDAMGIFDQNTTAAHCVWLTDNDRKILRERNVTVASNPVSNLKLASGICDVPALYDAGVNVAIGTDGPSSNNSLNFFEEMKNFALLGKVKSGNASAMDPKKVLYSATRAGAVAQGRDHCGLVKEGWHADLIVVDLDVPNMQPIEDVPTALVFSADGKDVVLTMVDGRVLYQDGEYDTIDVEEAMHMAKESRERVRAKVDKA